jgi:hypothetical protein
MNACSQHSFWTAVLALSLLGLSAWPQQSRAQAAWRQTVQVLAPVETNEVTGVLLDTLATSLEKRNAPVRKGPNAPVTTYSALQNDLSQDGLGVASATHVFITYHFQMTSAGTRYKILDLYFIFRPPNASDTDIPVLYVDLTDPEPYERYLVEGGTTIPYNEAAFLQFRDQVSFHTLRDMVRVVQVGEQIIRDPKLAAAEKQRILTITTQFTYR